MDNNEHKNIREIQNTSGNWSDNIPSPGRLFDLMMEGAFHEVDAILADSAVDHQMLGIYHNMMNSMSAGVSPEVSDTPQLNSPSTDLSSTDSASSSNDEPEQVQEHQENKEQTESEDKDKNLNLKKN